MKFNIMNNPFYPLLLCVPVTLRFIVYNLIYFVVIIDEKVKVSLCFFN